MSVLGRLLPIVILLLLAQFAPLYAADLPVEPAPSAKPAPPAKAAPPAKSTPSAAPTQSTPASVNASPLAPPTDACLEWSDGCRICQRPTGGEVACSNVGIACTPKQNRCVRQ